MEKTENVFKVKFQSYLMYFQTFKILTIPPQKKTLINRLRESLCIPQKTRTA